MMACALQGLSAQHGVWPSPNQQPFAALAVAFFVKLSVGPLCYYA